MKVLAATLLLSVLAPGNVESSGVERPSSLPSVSGDPLPTSACKDYNPSGTYCMKMTQCAALATKCDDWPQAVCMYSGGTNCECL